MCGFMAVSGHELTMNEFEAAFSCLKVRGPDATRCEQIAGGIMGFHRLAIMGLSELGMQPMKLHQNTCICNGEIYNEQELKVSLSSYEFISGSDCEVLLPMFEAYGCNMFERLDGEFAMVLYLGDTKEWLAARDPLGIRPMFYGYQKGNGNIAFASEMKALVKICDEVYPFPIGSYYYQGSFHIYQDCAKPKHQIKTKNHRDLCEGIRQRLEDAVIKRLHSDAPIGFLLSGGLDSSLVCSIAAKFMDQPIQTFAIGMRQDAIDLAYAREVASFIGSEHHEVIIDEHDVISSLHEVIYHLETYDITTIRASIAMFLLCKHIHETTDIKVLLTGEVSDELFGYKYTDFAPDATAFQKEAEKRISELYMYDVLRADRCISANALEGRVPFGDPEFVSYVMGIDPEIKLNRYGIGKYLLRTAFDDSDLPKKIRMREKAAFSDAVGHSMVDDLKAYAKTYYSDEEFERKKARYHHAQPFTKESLLYREIFESYYPNRAYVIKDFWMPNKEWEHCDVDDPSARVLSNYGNSGC